MYNMKGKKFMDYLFSGTELNQLNNIACTLKIKTCDAYCEHIIICPLQCFDYCINIVVPPCPPVCWSKI